MRGTLLALALVLAWPGRAAAQASPEDSERARHHLDRGTAYYDLQKYDQAIAEWEKGFELDQQPLFLWALGQAQRMKGDCEKAILYYEAYLRRAPGERRVRAAQERIEQCKAKLERKGKRAGKPTPSTEPEPAPTPAPAPARPPQAVAPAPEPVPLAPAPALVPTLEPGATGASERHFYQDWVGDTLVGVGALAFIIGGVLVVDGASAPDWRTSYDHFAQAKDGETEWTAGVVLMAAGGALVAGGVVRYYLHGRVTAEPARGGAVVTVGGAF